MKRFSPKSNRRISEDDVTLLSAYLDDQLAAADRARLEQRLRDEGDLRTELEELRATTMLLRALPVERPVRSFTLDPTTTLTQSPYWFGWLSSLQRGALLAACLVAAFVTTAVFIGQHRSATIAGAPSYGVPEATSVAQGVPEEGTANATTFLSPAPTMPPVSSEEEEGGVALAPAAKSPESSEETENSAEWVQGMGRHTPPADILPSEGVSGTAESNVTGSEEMSPAGVAPSEVIQDPDMSSPDTRELPSQVVVPPEPQAGSTGSMLNIIVPLAAVSLLGVGFAALFLWYRRTH